MTHHATQTLHDLGYRLTPQRTLVWDVLRREGRHMSAEVADSCGQFCVNIGSIAIGPG
jgi:Fe2+ or Zn2+ uptake regulation protein